MAEHRRPTSFQMQILGVVDAYGPIPVSEVDRHLLCGSAAARNAIVGLERRGLVDPVYTSHYVPQTAYVTTAAAAAVLEEEFGDDGDR